jgi:hypothetical protein
MKNIVSIVCPALCAPPSISGQGGQEQVSDMVPLATMPHPKLEPPTVAKSSPLASRQRLPARANLVSATVYLLPDQLVLIKQNCADTNRRISDLISEAVDDYLRKVR